MKNMMKSAIMLGLVLLFAGTTQKASAQDEDVSLQSFYDELSPYGTWIQDPQYGYVWRPDVDQDEFRPYYTNGRWVMTEYGNTWVSNYDWGWAPFHYGRWVYNSYNNWVWLPDTVWGPAWVSWRSGGGYYGWAPLGPSISIGINIGRGGYRVPDMCWSFIPYNNIYMNSYPRYSYSRNRVYIQNTVIINNTYVRNNRTYYTGPRVDDIRRHTNQRVNVYAVNRSHSPGVSRVENNRVTIYQPRASRDGNNNPAPRNAVQGSINRGPVGRDNNMTANRGNDRNDRSDNRFDGSRGNDNRSNDANRYGNRTQRNENGVPGRETNGRINTPSSNDNRGSDRSGAFGRSRENNGDNGQRIERSNGNNQPTQQQRVDRGRDMQQQAAQQRQQQMDRSREAQQQQAAQQRQQMDRSREVQQQQQAQQRQQAERSRDVQQRQQMERPVQQSAPRTERVERSQPQPQQQRGGGNEGRGESNRGGRPGRG